MDFDIKILKKLFEKKYKNTLVCDFYNFNIKNNFIICTVKYFKTSYYGINFNKKVNLLKAKIYKLPYNYYINELRKEKIKKIKNV